jgi:hypothetical protein
MKGPEIIWQPTNRQAVALASGADQLFFGGARGGGKSDFLIFDWLSHAEQEGPVAGIMVRRTYDELQEIEARCQMIMPRLGLTYSASERTWRHSNGSYLRLRYLETIADASRYQGHEYQWAGVDEAGNYPSSQVVDLLNGCLRTKRKRQRCLLRLSGNPGGPGHGWLKARFITGNQPEMVHWCPETGVSRVFVPSRLEDNPHIQDADSYRARLAGAGPAHLVRAWLLGDWDVLPNGGILRPDEIRQGKPPPREQMRIYFAIDPAARAKDKTGGNPDNSCIAVVGVDPERNLWLLDMWAEAVSSSAVWDQLSIMMRRYDPEMVWLEGGPIGAAVLPLWEDAQRRAGTYWPIKEVSHMGDKVGKAQPLAAAIDRGLVYADKTAAWYPAFRDEATVFDGSDDRKDDRVDAVGIVARMLRQTMAGEPESAAKAMLPPRSRAGLGIDDQLTARKPSTGGLVGRSAFRR